MFDCIARDPFPVRQRMVPRRTLLCALAVFVVAGSTISLSLVALVSVLKPSFGAFGAFAPSLSMNGIVKDAIDVLRSKGVRFFASHVTKLRHVSPQSNSAWSYFLHVEVDLAPSIINPASWASTSTRLVFWGIQQRVMALFGASGNRHTSSSVTAPAGVHTFSDSEFPGFANLPMVQVTTMRAQLVQKGGSCFGAASIVTQYGAIWNTLVARGTNASKHGLLDFRRYIVEHFTEDELENYVLNDVGIPSIAFLQRILEPGSIIVTSDSSLYGSRLAQYGLALVSLFSAFEDFMNESVHHHEGLPVGKFVAYHAMVLHSERVDAAGNTVYLLQNWCGEAQPSTSLCFMCSSSPRVLQVEK